jgi:hypothetical protein
MTRISSASLLRRETDTVYRGRALVIELRPNHLTIGEKRKKYRVTIDYATVYETAMKMLARAEAAEKKIKGGKR